MSLAGGPREVRLLVASAGNQVMQELADAWAIGFAAIGIPARVDVDAIPDPSLPPETLQVVVAPHEFGPLLLEPRLGAAARSALRPAYVLNVEQPGSGWFETAVEWGRRSRGWWDLSILGVEEMGRRGLPALHAPVGCPASWIPEGTDDPDGRDIDVVFLGAWSPRRERFLAGAADELAARSCRLHVARIEEPRREGTAGFVTGGQLPALLRRARLLVNVHLREDRYFEWHRMLRAFAAGCAVATEASDGVEPLRPGVHFEEAPFAGLADAMKRLLDDEPRRRAMAEQALEMVRTALSPPRAAERLLDRLVAPERFVETGRRHLTRLRYFGWQGKVALRGAVAATVAAAEAGRRRVVDRVAAPSVLSARLDRLEERVEAGAATPAVPPEARLLRLEVARAAEASGSPPWELAPNDAWEATPSAGLSVVIPLFNYEGWIGECVRSVEAMSTGSIPGGVEVVLVDDASTNGARREARLLAARSPLPVLLVEKRLNTGLADTRNLGLRFARGPWVFPLDADNRVYPAGPGKLVAAAEAERLDAVFGILKRFEPGGAPLGLASFHEWDLRQLVRRPYIDAMAVIRTDRLREIGGYATEMAIQGWEDYDLWLRLGAEGARCRLVPELIGEYRVHPGSMLNETNRDSFRLSQHFRRKFLSLASRFPGDDELFGFPR